MGLSNEFKAAFPDVVSVNRLLIYSQKKMPHPQWLAGFRFAEGYFFINIVKAKTNIGKAVQLVFQLIKHFRNK